MKPPIILITLVFIILGSCKNTKKNDEEASISIASIIRGQVNHIDTSLYLITRFDMDNGKTDTTYIRREEVRDIAAPFLSLPDLSDTKLKNQYTEEKLIDKGQNTLSITSSLKNEYENAEIQKQIIIVGLDDLSNGRVQSFFIDRLLKHGDSTIQQKLFWKIDEYFQIGTIMQKNDEPEKTHITKVSWQ